MITERLTHKGTMYPGLLYERPVVDLASTGTERVFEELRAGKLVDRIQELHESAVA